VGSSPYSKYVQYVGVDVCWSGTESPGLWIGEGGRTC
jgi:hypothetical protein